MLKKILSDIFQEYVSTPKSESSSDGVIVPPTGGWSGPWQHPNPTHPAAKGLTFSTKGKWRLRQEGQYYLVYNRETREVYLADKEGLKALGLI